MGLAPTLRTRRSEDGAAAVEFALVFVFILVPLVFGMITYGFALHYRQAVSQAATEGARAAAVAPGSWSDAEKQESAESAVSAALNAYGITCAGGKLTKGGASIGECTAAPDTSCNGNASNNCARVHVSLADDNPLVPEFPGLGFLVPAIGYTAQAEVSE